MLCSKSEEWTVSGGKNHYNECKIKYDILWTSMPIINIDIYTYIRKYIAKFVFNLPKSSDIELFKQRIINNKLIWKVFN